MRNKNEWKQIWSKKGFSSDGDNGIEDLFLQMKIADGYDTLGDLKITFSDFKAQFNEMLYHLENSCNGKQVNAQSAFEVGCGCGPNLLLLQEKGLSVGGIDYSEGLIESAKKYIKTNDLTVAEAANLAVNPKYDIVFSKGCFCYFESEEYALHVMELMYEKANFSIGILDLFDATKEQEFLKYRREHIANYDEKYKSLGKLFVSKEFFSKFASEHDLDITFTDTNLPGYWNNEFIFNVFMHK